MEMAARTLWTLFAEEDPEKMQESLPETQSHAVVRSLPATAKHVSLQTRGCVRPWGSGGGSLLPAPLCFITLLGREFILCKSQLVW